MDDALWLLGRVCLGAVFVAGAINHCFAFPTVADQIAKRGLPWPRMVLVAGSVWQMMAGIMFMAGLQVAWAAAALVAFTVTASLMLLDFWNKQGAERTGMLTSWRLNIAVIGGLLVSIAYARP